MWRKALRPDDTGIDDSREFLSYRAAIPLAQEQISVMMSILRTRPEPVKNFLDLGCGDGILAAAILGERI